MYWTRWNPLNQTWWNQVNQMHNEMNRLLEHWGGANQPGPRGAVFPVFNMREDGDALHIESELPGLNLDEVEIYVTGNNQLTIQGQRKPQAPEKSVQHRRERPFGTFSRTIALPVAVDADQVDARLENGVLSLRLGKQELAKPRKIAVKG